MPKMYYCTECKRRHKSGKIYQEHLKYKLVETPEYDSNKIQKIEFTLRVIARRQIETYKRKIINSPNLKKMYIEKINELIEHERRREQKREWALS